MNIYMYIYIYITICNCWGGSGGFTSKSLSYTTFVFGMVT